MTANDTQIGGDHYKEGGDKQHWDFVAEYLGCRYYEGNATKYIWRYKKKNGLQDLTKALHYVQKLLELTRNGKVSNKFKNSDYGLDGVISYYKANNLDTTQRWLTTAILECDSKKDLKRICKVLNGIIKHYNDGEPDAGYVNQD